MVYTYEQKGGILIMDKDLIFPVFIDDHCNNIKEKFYTATDEIELKFLKSRRNLRRCKVVDLSSAELEIVDDTGYMNTFYLMDREVY